MKKIILWDIQMESEIVLLLFEIAQIDCSTNTKSLLFSQLNGDIIYNVHDRYENHIIIENVDGLCFETVKDKVKVR